jgi:hypothetical protein
VAARPANGAKVAANQYHPVKGQVRYCDNEFYQLLFCTCLSQFHLPKDINKMIVYIKGNVWEEMEMW